MLALRPATISTKRSTAEPANRPTTSRPGCSVLVQDLSLAPIDDPLLAPSPGTPMSNNRRWPRSGYTQYRGLLVATNDRLPAPTVVDPAEIRVPPGRGDLVQVISLASTSVTGRRTRHGLQAAWNAALSSRWWRRRHAPAGKPGFSQLVAAQAPAVGEPSAEGAVVPPYPRLIRRSRRQQGAKLFHRAFQPLPQVPSRAESTTVLSRGIRGRKNPPSGEGLVAQRPIVW